MIYTNNDDTIRHLVLYIKSIANLNIFNSIPNSLAKETYLLARKKKKRLLGLRLFIYICYLPFSLREFVKEILYNCILF